MIFINPANYIAEKQHWPTFYLASVVQLASKFIYQIIDGIYSWVQFIFSEE